MSENWKIQVSVKIDGTHLLNLRADTAEEFGPLLKWAVENAEQFQAATSALEGKRTASVVTPHHAPIVDPSAPNRVSGPSGEIGPVQIKGVSKAALKKDGTPMKSPKYTVEFSNGKKLSTFEPLVGQAAESLSGQSVYYSTKVNGQYTNLDTVRSAQ